MIIGNGVIETEDLFRTGEGWYEEGQWFEFPPASYVPDINSMGTLKITELGGHLYYNTPTWFEVTNIHPTESAQLSRYHLRSYYIEQGSPPTSYQPEIFPLPPLVIPPGSYALIRGQFEQQLTSGGMTVFILKDGIRTPYWDETGGHLELLTGAQSTGFQTADSLKIGFDNLSNLSPEWAGATVPAAGSSVENLVLGYSYSRSSLNGDTNTAADWVRTPWATPGGPNDVAAGATDGDADGIPDTAESPGGTFAGLPLYDWGARTGKKDIFIHVDFMDQTGRLEDEGIIPHKDALTKVVATFGAKNIAVHFDTGDLYGEHQLILPSQVPPSHKVPFALGATLGKEPGLANVYDYKNSTLPEARRQIFHYLLFGNTQQANGNAGSSGLGELRGNDFLVTLGKWGLSTMGNLKFTASEKYWELVNIQASTIMHELGHNLGLHHGGAESRNYKPNYLSVMNYLYQISGLPVVGTQEGDRFYWGQFYQKDEKNSSSLFLKYFNDGYKSGIFQNEYGSGFSMDFSQGQAVNLSETNLSENLGLGLTGTSGVDFNGDGDTLDTGLSLDINLDTQKSVLSDYADWSHLILDFQHTYESDSNGSTRSLVTTRRLMLENDTQEIVPEYDHPIGRE
ncbi:MAG: hypothetical protein A2Z96_02560 [Spirochaetes bacterium GWB1_48_6]|nr:MAG: hypothetical protein A2Z96_02560 [Spirochaetes bacterium GWB1_48_6]